MFWSFTALLQSSSQNVYKKGNMFCFFPSIHQDIFMRRKLRWLHLKNKHNHLLVQFMCEQGRVIEFHLHRSV